MNALPKSASKVSVDTEGSAFTREFKIGFNADEPDILEWLNKSKGTSALNINKSESHSTYKIEACAGAQFAELQINWKTQHVTIHTYWS